MESIKDSGFRTSRERDAYQLLHTEGVITFDERYGMLGSRMLNDWARRGLVRVTYPAGSMTVRTFKKYAQ